MPVSQTKGVILLAAAQKKVPVMEFTPLQVKMTIAGYGRAEKKQVQKMIEKTVDLTGFDLKKNFRKKDDAYDAIGVALCAALKQYWNGGEARAWQYRLKKYNNEIVAAIFIN